MNGAGSAGTPLSQEGRELLGHMAMGTDRGHRAERQARPLCFHAGDGRAVVVWQRQWPGSA